MTLPVQSRVSTRSRKEGVIFAPIFGPVLALMILLAGIGGLPDAAQAAGGGGHGPASGSFDLMVPMEPMPIPIIQQARVRGILLVEFYLEASDQTVAGHIHHLMPRLKDSLRTGLSEFAAHEVRMDRPVNLERLDLYISREVRNVLHDGRTRVVFRQVMVQPQS